MANRKVLATAPSTALADEVERAGRPEIAAKLRALDAVYAGLAPDAGGHRPLTGDERKTQTDNTLTVDELDAVQAIEYGTWVAVEDISIGTALAYGVGHPVPVTNVAAHGYDTAGLVARVADVLATAAPNAAAPLADTIPPTEA